MGDQATTVLLFLQRRLVRPAQLIALANVLWNGLGGPPCFDGGLNRSFSFLDFIHDRLWYPDPSRRSSGQSYSMQWQVSSHQIHCSERAVRLNRSLLVFPLEGGRRGCSSTCSFDHVGAFRSCCVGDLCLESYGTSLYDRIREVIQSYPGVSAALHSSQCSV